MDNCSYSSSMGKPVSRKPTAENNSGAGDEESGWTAYFQDFFNNNIDNNNNIINDDDDNIIDQESFCSSSLISDAASYAAWKISNSPDPQYNYEAPKKLNFKKTRAKEISQDDSLKDTASSPVNSPKVGDLNAVDMKAQQTDNLIDASLGKRGKSEYYSEQQPEEKSIVDFNGENDCLDLKKRGLCLVPLSMLVNYLG